MNGRQMYLFFLLFCLISPLLSGCGQRSGTEEMADGLCGCMRPMAEAIREMEKLTADTSAQPNLDTLQQAMADIGSVRAGVDGCIDQLEARFGDDLEKSEKAVREEMARRCPDVVAAMQSSRER